MKSLFIATFFFLTFSNNAKDQLSGVWHLEKCYDKEKNETILKSNYISKDINPELIVLFNEGIDNKFVFCGKTPQLRFGGKWILNNDTEVKSSEIHSERSIETFPHCMFFLKEMNRVNKFMINADTLIIYSDHSKKTMTLIRQKNSKYADQKCNEGLMYNIW